MERTLHGIYTPFAVPTRDDGSINEPELRRYLRWIIAKGVHGLYPNGSTGEFIRFTLEERRTITRITVEEAAGKLPVLAGAAEPTLPETVESSALYRDLGCLAVSICPPYYFKPSQDALHSHFTTIAHLSALPVVLYQIPAFATPLSPELVLQLAEEPNIIGIKDSSRDFVAFTSLLSRLREVRPDFSVLIGTEEILLPALFMGADGGALASSGIVPEAVLSLYGAWQQGDHEEARQWQSALLPLIGAMFSHDFPAGFRMGAAARGFSMGQGRQPLSPEQVVRLDTLKRDLQLAIPALLTRGEGGPRAD
jgi:2-dehydro-3-deoxy-D-pentonate aldolase